MRGLLHKTKHSRSFLSAFMVILEDLNEKIDHNEMIKVFSDINKLMWEINLVAWKERENQYKKALKAMVKTSKQPSRKVK